MARAKSAAEKVARDNQIVAAKSRGLNTSTVAESFAVSEKTVEKVMEEFKASSPSLRTVDPIEVIESMIFEYRGAIEELALISSSTKYDAVRVGAVSKRVETIEKIAKLMQATGVLPNDLGTLKIDMDVRAFATVVLEVFKEAEIPDEAVATVMERIGRFSGRQLPRGA